MVSKYLRKGRKRNHGGENHGHFSFGFLHAKRNSSGNLTSQWGLNKGRQFMFKSEMFLLH